MMEIKKKMDLVLVPIGLVIMVSYHVWLFFRIKRHPKTTVLGINAINRVVWVKAMMSDSKNGILAVQTLRSSIMASTLLSTTAIMLSSLIVVLMTSNSVGISSGSEEHHGGLFYGNHSKLLLSIKFFTILLCFLTAFLLFVQSVRYSSHTGVLINVPLKNQASILTPEYVGRIINKGSYFWSFGMRAFYFSFPLVLWIFGPIPMFVSCIGMVFFLYFLDTTNDPVLSAEVQNVESV